jgi:hypothetical protein
VPDPAPGRDLSGCGSLWLAMVIHRLLARATGAVVQKGPGGMIMMSVDEARRKLEQLLAETAAADPFQPAPPIWIAELHRALGALAVKEALQRYRLDGVQGVNMAYLHRRVAAVLGALDQGVARKRG